MTSPESRRLIVESDYGSEIRVLKPQYAASGHGYADWRAAINQVKLVLPHDTESGANTMFSVVRRIGLIYWMRGAEDQSYSSNRVVQDMDKLLARINMLFKKDCGPAALWRNKLPLQSEIHALAFSAEKFVLSPISRLGSSPKYANK